MGWETLPVAASDAIYSTIPVLGADKLSKVQTYILHICFLIKT